MHLSPGTLKQVVNDAVPILFKSGISLVATMGLYAFTIVFSSTCLGVNLELLAVVKTASALAATVLALALDPLACTVRRALRTGD